MQEVERAVERVIQSIHENYGEQLTIDDMARTAMYSKFHFTRIFQRVTGLTPGRFLSAVRLQKAKQLLTATSLKVTDISHMVGYTSVGTFSSRFCYSVGVPPSSYRQLGGYRPWEPVDGHRGAGSQRGGTGRRSVIRGHVAGSAPDREGPVFIGLFPERIPQSQPVSCAIVSRSGPYALEDVPPGTWYVMACSPVPDLESDPAEGSAHGPTTLAGRQVPPIGGLSLGRDQMLYVGVNGPVVTRPGMVRLADVRLRRMGLLDPPVLLALPDMRPETLAARAGSAA